MAEAPNPNGANGTTSDPREQTCWDLYLKSILEGQENAHKAAIDAGYEESSAKNITLRGWFKERLDGLKRKEMVSKSEKKFVEALDYPAVNEKGGVDVQLLRVQTDVAKHITNTLGKDLGYSTKTETDLTSKGEKLEGAVFNIVKPE